MADSTDPLVLDLVEWMAREQRLCSEVINLSGARLPSLIRLSRHSDNQLLLLTNFSRIASTG